MNNVSATRGLSYLHVIGQFILIHIDALRPEYCRTEITRDVGIYGRGRFGPVISLRQHSQSLFSGERFHLSVKRPHLNEIFRPPCEWGLHLIVILAADGTFRHHVSRAGYQAYLYVIGQVVLVEIVCTRPFDRRKYLTGEVRHYHAWSSRG